MQTDARHQLILAQARQSGKVEASALAHDCRVAVQTIRRDLRDLVKAGLLERTHGGAVLPSGTRNIAYDDRRALNRDAKARIAARAAQLVPDNASLFLNIGTTTEALARALRHHRNLKVVTNNLNVATTLMGIPGFDIVVAGGTLRPTDGGLVGDLAAIAIARFKVDIAIIGASAIDHEGDMLDFDAEEVRVSQAIITAARQTIVVADKSKFTRKAPVKISSLSEVDHVVTDGLPSERLANACADWGTKVHLV